MSARSFLFRVFAGTFFILNALPSGGAEPEVSTLPKVANREVAFEKDIKPILERSCAQCHGADRPKGRFRVDSRAALLKGGDSGESAIVPGKSAGSQLVRFVSDAVKEMEMPPLEKRQKFPALTETEIGLIRAWIDQGANWPEGATIVAPSSNVAEHPALQSEAASSRNHPIFAMIRQGDRRGIADALRDGSILNERDENGNTPLIQAAFYLNAKELALFLQKGAEINATNNNGVSALMKAVWDLEKTQMLLRRGANVNAASKQGNTPLIIAAFAYGMGEVVKELVAAGSTINASNQAGLNAVLAAAEAGDVEILKTLLDHQGDPNSKSKIVESNCDVSALMIAAQMGHLDCVKLLLDRGADPNMTLEHGNALHFAAFTQRREIVRLLLDRGLNVNARGRRLLSFRNDTDLTPLMYAALNERNDPTIVQWLVGNGADVNARASCGETAFSIAQLRGNTKIVAALLAAGAKVETAGESAPQALLWKEEQTERPNSRLERKAAEAGISLLLKSSARLTDATGNRCFTCHQQSQPALAWSLARKTGVDYPEEIVASELKTTLVAAKRRMEGATEGPLPVPNIAGWLLVGLDAAQYPADTITDYYAYSLARYQFGDGRWITKASRAPSDYSDVSSTAVAIRALKSYAPPTMKKRFDRNIAKAARWLRQFESQSTEERAMQLLGLYWAGERAELKRLAQALIAEQRLDGGWAQISTLESDAYATGLALYALNEAGGISPAHPAYQNGVKFLLRHQQADGSWRVQTRTSPVQVAINEIFSHGKDQWISSIATGWSAAALARASAESDGENPNGR